MIATIEELRADLDHAVATAKSGEAVIVTEAGRPIAQILPARAVRSPLPADWPERRQRWLEKIDRLRATTGTGKSATPSEKIIEELREERC